MTKKFLIADDHYIVRLGTTLILESSFKGATIEHASNFVEVLKKIEIEHYDLLFLDIEMQGSLYKKMISKIKNMQPEIKILVYTAYDEDFALQYLLEGANGYLNKNAKEDEICLAVNSIIDNNFYHPLRIVNKIILEPINKSPLEKLSEREYELFIFLTDGDSNFQICSKTNLSTSTISTYKKRLFKKLNVKNLTDLIDIKKKYH
jgi:DNA-binding NarL/FixJ family response regulator